MTQPGGAAVGPARRTHRGHPRCCAGIRRAWRARYGEEFTELLLADFAERPRSWRRTANVVAERAARPAGRPGADRVRRSSAPPRSGPAWRRWAARWPRSSPSGWPCWPSWPSAGSGPSPRGARHHRRHWPLMAARRAPLALLGRPVAAGPAGRGGRWPGCSRRRPARLARGALLAGGMVAGHRGAPLPERTGRAPAGRPAPRPGARRAGRVRLGVHPVGLVVLGPPGRPGALPRRLSSPGWC